MSLHKAFSKKIILSVLALTLFCGIGLYRLDKLNSTPIEAANFSWFNKVEIYSLALVLG